MWSKRTAMWAVSSVSHHAFGASCGLRCVTCHGPCCPHFQAIHGETIHLAGCPSHPHVRAMVQQRPQCGPHALSLGSDSPEHHAPSFPRGVTLSSSHSGLLGALRWFFISMKLFLNSCGKSKWCFIAWTFFQSTDIKYLLNTYYTLSIVYRSP